MKIGIYSPYLDTFGGGEKYMMTIAELLSQTETVEILLGSHLYSLETESFKNKMQRLHNIDLSKVLFIKSPIGKGSAFLSRFLFLKKYDWFFYLTDGSMFYCSSKNSVLHFQVPFQNVKSNNLWGRIKLWSWKKVIYNSFFTKEIVEESWPIKGDVVYPPISVDSFKPQRKEKQIISVGRFFGFSKDKKQQLLIDIFKQLVREGKLDNWSLHLVGIASGGDEGYINELRKGAKKFDIFFYPNLSFKDLKKLYATSSIYWHATGYGEDDPRKFEHFGISTVEAMASGCVPIVIDKGGQKEIVEDQVSGFLWTDVAELKNLTKKVTSDVSLQQLISINAQKRANKFSKEIFAHQIEKLVYTKND